MAVIEQMTSPPSPPDSTTSPSIRDPKPDLVAFLSKKDELWRPVCKRCGAGWPWAHFGRNKEDGMRNFSQEICARCEDPAAEGARWQDALKEMESRINTQREALSSSASTDIPPPIPSHSNDTQTTTNAATATPFISNTPTKLPAPPPAVLPQVPGAANTAAIVYPPTPTSAPLPRVSDADLRDIAEPERATRWLMNRYRAGTTSPLIIQMQVYRDYQKAVPTPTHSTNTNANPTLAGSEFVALVQIVFPSVWLETEGYAFGGLVQVEQKGTAGGPKTGAGTPTPTPSKTRWATS